MPGTIDTAALRARLDAGEAIQLVEVLPAPEYELEHLPGARHLPLTELDRAAVRDLEVARPGVAYCFDYQ